LAETTSHGCQQANQQEATMTIDMSQFYQVFFEEAAELLDDMETLLLNLDIENPSTEDLNAIFRVAHSIKGGAATFGFTDMASVTHVLESLLDRLRNHELAIRSDMVEAFLQAGDVVKGQLAGHRGEGTPDSNAADEVCLWLKKLATGETLPTPQEKIAEDPGKPAEVAGESYRIEFSFSSTRATWNNLLANLGEHGSLSIVAGPDLPPDQAGTDTIVFEPVVLEITTEVAEEDLWEALAFVVDPAKIKVEAIKLISADLPQANVEVATAPVAADDDGFGFFEPLYKAVLEDHTSPAAQTAGQLSEEKSSSSSEEEARSGGAAFGRRSEDDPQRSEIPRGRRESDKNATPATADSTSIRVNIEKVDQLINLVGELVITQSMLTQNGLQLDPVTHERLLKGLDQLERNTRDLQESVMSIRMMPISFVFSRFPRLVRDLATKLNKDVELKTVGENTELDKGLIEKIADPLTHLVRNSIDHGIETPEKRVAAGKPAKGTITLRAFHQGGSITIEVIDDGAGLNRDKILAKARSQGIAVADTMTDTEVWNLIFEAGFSTAEVVTDISGRGVGMDVVRRNIQALGGSVEIDSALGFGTRMIIRLPLTLAIVDGLSVAVADQTFIVPLTYIIESLQPRPEDIKTVGNGDTVIHVRGEYLPIVRADEYFGVRTHNRDVSNGIIVILEAEGIKKALVVDELLGQNQVVIKSLESNYRKVRGVSGATIMGNGRVALILDVGAIVRNSGVRLLEAA
jgi:two-component system chemotaxis sensor kinase CheA